MPKYLFVLIFLFLAGCDQQESRPGTVTEVTMPDVIDLPDFTQYRNVKKKKQAFFSYMLPLVRAANEEVLLERQLVQYWADGGSLNGDEQQQIQQLLSRYRITLDDEDQQQALLLRRVNVIPPSLVLAQAANESGWGTSRFAREGNNLFGEWCFSAGCGMIPEARHGNARHEVRRFETPLDSVRSYILNLNSHPRYRELRDLRLKSINEKGYVSGQYLVAGLSSYSERGHEYIDEIRNMIQFNKLGRYDQQQLSASEQPAQPASGG